MERLKQGTITLLLLGVLAAHAAAQQAPGPQDGGPGPGRPNDQQREEVRKKVEAVRLARLTEALQLDEKTAAKFVPVITAIEQKRRALLKENQETMRELEIMLHAKPPDESKLKIAISAIEKNRREIVSLRDKESEAVKDSLTVAQQARYIIFNHQFMREMRGMVEGVRGGKGPGKGLGPGRGSGPRPANQ